MELRINPQVRFSFVAEGVKVEPPSGNPVVHSSDLALLLSELATAREYDDLVSLFDDRDSGIHLLDELMDQNVLVPALELEMGFTHPLPSDLSGPDEEAFRKIHRAVRGRTMSTPSLNYALYQAVRYVAGEKIPGAFVETGVWRGGSAGLAALTFKLMRDVTRPFYLYDTYTWSWPAETERDRYPFDKRSPEELAAWDASAAEPAEDEDLVSIDHVRKFLAETGYPEDKLTFVKGLTQDTVPQTAPEQIAILRLDTDLFESTYHELKHLYPRLVSGGVLLVDDYAIMPGATRAVEQYFHELGSGPFLGRIETQGRIGIKR